MICSAKQAFFQLIVMTRIFQTGSQFVQVQSGAAVAQLADSRWRDTSLATECAAWLGAARRRLIHVNELGAWGCDPWPRPMIHGPGP